MTLLTLIHEHVAKNGPMPLSEYMGLALGHPEYGYYMRRDPLGAAGDFTTAPEISQLFGEMLGIWVVHQWQQQGKPETFLLVEAGPGRGTLMADILRVLKKSPDCLAACDIRLIETSPVLREKQQATLAEYTHITWQDTFDDLPSLPLFFICNEFFDALPIEQYVYRVDGWYQRCIMGNNETGTKLCWKEGQKADLAMSPQSGVPVTSKQASQGTKKVIPLPQPTPGAILECSPVAEAIMTGICQHITRHGGAALIVDYGYGAHAYGDTLQAVKNHQYHDVLEAPGDADITAHVNFAQLCTLAETAGLTAKLTSQGMFLEQMGIAVRLHVLCGATAEASQREALISGVQRLIDPAQMGELFKVLEVVP